MKAILRITSVGMMFICAGSLPADIVTWNGSVDNTWTNAPNWDTGSVPANGDDVFISNGDSVIASEFNTGFNLTLSGGSNLLDPDTAIAGGAWRAGGASVLIDAGSTFGSGGFYDLQNATLTFEDGAAVNTGGWEHKTTNSFIFVLGATGFTTVTPGTGIFGNDGGGPATFADASWEVDFANFTGLGSYNITLMDFNNNSYGGAPDTDLTSQFTPQNAPAGLGSLSLTFVDTTDSIELSFTVIPEPSTLVLAGMGFVALYLRRRRQN